MKRKLISLLVLFMVAMATVTTQAQTRDSVAFQPHWFVQPQVGVGYHVGEAKFSKLLSPTAALSVGRQFSPVFGLRLGASGWQARNWQTHPVAEYKWNYVQANLDATVSLTNLIWGWNADRKWNTKLFPAGRLGAGIEYALSERVALGLEYNANVLPDKWNSKKGKSDNMDWQQNLLVGVKISLGKTRKHITIEEPVQPVVEPEPVVEQKPEPIVEKPKPVVETKQVVVKAPDMAEVKVYFAPSSSKLTSAEAEKLQSVVEYLKKYGEKNVIVSGYASSDGQKAYNQRLSKRRAKAVEQWLSNNGIDATRIKAEGKGEVDFGSRKESRAAATIAIEK